MMDASRYGFHAGNGMTTNRALLVLGLAIAGCTPDVPLTLLIDADTDDGAGARDGASDGASVADLATGDRAGAHGDVVGSAIDTYITDTGDVMKAVDLSPKM